MSPNYIYAAYQNMLKRLRQRQTKSKKIEKVNYTNTKDKNADVIYQCQKVDLKKVLADKKGDFIMIKSTHQ